MKYNKITKGRFISRPNRFIADVEIEGKREIVHVKNTGRCRELLLEGARVWLYDSENPQRKTRYDLIAVEKERAGKEPVLINIDSQIPNSAAAEWLPVSKLFSDKAHIRREVTFGASRFDFYIEDGIRRAFLEVKGVTLERDGVVLFPDAPTERGVKHIDELVSCLDEGYEAYILFVVQMKEVEVFRPNDEMHKAFGDALRRAASRGVKVIAMDCIVTPDSMMIDKPIKVEL
jgi:sugar fermentation stimulation protein A